MSVSLTCLAEGYLLTGQDATHMALSLKAGLKQMLTDKEGVADSLSLGCLPILRALFYCFPVPETSFSSYDSASGSTQSMFFSLRGAQGCFVCCYQLSEQSLIC